MDVKRNIPVHRNQNKNARRLEQRNGEWQVVHGRMRANVRNGAQAAKRPAQETSHQPLRWCL